MILSKEIGLMAEQLSKQKQQAVFELLKSMLDDDYLTLEDKENIKQSREEYSKGEYVRHEDIDWG